MLLSLALLIAGCAQNYYNIPKESFQKKVRILGVAPIVVDADSDIAYPDKGALLSLLKEANRANGPELVAELKDTGTFFDVRTMGDDPDQFFSALFYRREKRDDAGVAYNKYFYKLPELKEYITRNGVDALMIVVVSGITKRDTMRASNLIDYLEAKYNYLIVTAQILDVNGDILWEYPNFHERVMNYPTFLALQYPDFDEARANMSDLVEVRFKSIAGLTKALTRSEPSQVLPKGGANPLYVAQFQQISGLLTNDEPLFGGDSKKPAASPVPASPAPAPAPMYPAPPPTASQPPQAPPAAPSISPGPKTPPPLAVPDESALTPIAPPKITETPVQ